MKQIDLVQFARIGGHMTDQDDPTPVGQIASYCGRLSCRKPIVQDIGPGRRKEFCSDTCRRGADRDYKRAKAHVEFFEEQLRRTQHEVATYGRRADHGLLTADEVLRLQAEARVALVRAMTVMELGGDQLERIRVELDALITAIRPILGTDQMLLAVRIA